MAKGDGSYPKDIDTESTLGEVLQHLGTKYIVAILESNKRAQTPTPVIRKRNDTSNVLPFATTAICNGNDQVAMVENRAGTNNINAEILITNKVSDVILFTTCICVSDSNLFPIFVFFGFDVLMNLILFQRISVGSANLCESSKSITLLQRSERQTCQRAWNLKQSFQKNTHKAWA